MLDHGNRSRARSNFRVPVYQQFNEQYQRAVDFRKDWQDTSDQSRKDKEKLEQEAAQKARDGDITDPLNRFKQAMGRYNGTVESALAVFAREGELFAEGQEKLNNDAAKEPDLLRRKDILLRKAIQHAEYMQITDTRVAGMSYVITGQKEKEGSIKAIWTGRTSGATRPKPCELSEARCASRWTSAPWSSSTKTCANTNRT